MTEVAAPSSSGARTIAVLTTGRQDWGILHSTCDAIRARHDLRLQLLVGGMHLSAHHGRTIDVIRADGFEPAAELRWLNGPEDPPADVQAAAAVAAVGAQLRREPPHALLLVGDRFETAAAALAATLNRVPIAHLHGGEQTLGAFDDALRHAISKLSHLHLVAHPEYARRLVAMGEDPLSVHVVGAPGLDAAFRLDLAGPAELERILGARLAHPLVIVTVHPVTLDANPAAVAEAVLAAMDLVPADYVITLPNADPGGVAVRDALARSLVTVGRSTVSALGERAYWGLMRAADAMLGNSSSGLIEAPAVALPVVNVGDRQLGRRREANIVDVQPDPEKIAEALRLALSPAFRAGLRASRSPLLDGHAGERVAEVLAAWAPAVPPRKPPIPVVDA